MDDKRQLEWEWSIVNNLTNTQAQMKQRIAQEGPDYTIGHRVPAMDLTTSEICNALKTSEFIDPYATKAIEILQECDLVKFTSMNPTEREASKCTSETIQLITDTKRLVNGNGRQEKC